jgi:hypothetical protein
VRIGSSITPRLGFAFSDLSGDLLLGRGIDPQPVGLRHERPLRAITQDLDHRPVIFEAD